MEQLTEEDNKKSTRKSKNGIFKDAIFVNDEHISRIDQLKGNDGELPLFSSSSSLHLNSKANDMNFDHKPVEPKWPPGNQESGSWASSFRFELDTRDDDKLQAMLKQDEQIPTKKSNVGQELIDCQSLTEPDAIDGGSFRFLRNEELHMGNQYGHFKLPRQPESFGTTTIFNATKSQGYDIIAQSSGSLNDGPARIKVIVNDHVVASPRSEVLQRLRDLKAHPLSPSLSPEDTTSYQKEKDKIIVVKDGIQQRLKPLLKNEYLGKGSSNPITEYYCKPQANVLSELEIMEFKERRRQSLSLPSEVRGSPQRTPQPPLPMHSTTLKLRFRDNKKKLHDGHSKGERIVVNNIDSPSLAHVHSKHVAIPFMWEDKPGKPKTIAAAVDRVLARRLSRDGIEYMDLQLGLQKDDAKSSNEHGHFENGTGLRASKLSLSSSSNVDQRSGSHRYYGRDYSRGLSREASLRRSTRRYSTSEKEALIDLDGSAAAKFLVEAFDSPSKSHSSSPTFLVPFKWEDAPGKAKVGTMAQRPNNVLQLPPRLALPSLSRPESFSSHKHRTSASIGGFFLPCLASPMLVHQKQFTSSYNLPPKLPSPPKRLTRLGLVNHCSSTPKEGCQVWGPKPETSSRISPKKSLTEAQLTPIQKCTNLSASELNIKSNGPSLPTNILCGPNKYSSQTSRSSTMFSSGDLEEFTTQTQKSASKSSSSTSDEYTEEDLTEFSNVATTKLVEDTKLLGKKGVPTLSGCLNNKGKTLTLETLPTLESKMIDSSPEASPKRPSRLPYTMPSVAEQLLASCNTSGRRQLLQDLSPRLLHQFSSRRHSGSHSCINIPYRYLTSASHKRVVSPSPLYTVSVELLSSPTNEQTPKALVPKLSLARPRRRAQLLSSIFRTLKRALGRKKRSLKRSEPMLTYLDDGKSPAADFPTYI